MSIRMTVHKLLTTLVLLSLVLSPVQPLARAGQPAATPPVPAAEPAMPGYTGLFRTTVTVRGPADWRRLEELGVVVLEEITAQEITADRQENADQERAKSAVSRESAVILATEDQLEALAAYALSRGARTSWGRW